MLFDVLRWCFLLNHTKNYFLNSMNALNISNIIEENVNGMDRQFISYQKKQKLFN